MGTVAEKLTYLNGTKSSLKTAINNLGGDITSSTTFRNYATELDSIYSNLPKVSGTGTNVSLSPTLKGRLGIVPKGNTYQESTTGKNLLPINQIQSQTINGITITNLSDGTIKINGTTTITTRIDVAYTKELIANTQYKFTNVNTRGTGTNVNVQDSNNNVIGSIVLNVSSQTFTPTTTQTITKMRLYIDSGQTFDNYILKAMLIKSSDDATKFEPYTGGQASPNPDYPQEIQSATGTQKVVVSGKNLYNINNFSISSWDAGGGNYTSKVDNTILTISDFTNYRSKCVEIPSLKKNTDYVLSGNLKSTNTNGGKVVIYGYNGSSTTQIKANDGTLSTSNFSLSFNTGSYTNIGVSFNGVGGSAPRETIFDNIQIEQGNTATPYQPYQEPQEVDIELSNIELNKIGNYEDYIDGTPDNWVLYKKTRKVELAISDMNNNEDYPGWKNVQHINNDYPNNNTPLNALCDYKSNINVSTNEGIGINTNSGNATLQLRKAVFNLTQTQWKQQYPNLVFELVYGLQEYETTPITDTNLVSQLNDLYYLMSYDDTTNIDVTGNLPMRITASAIKGA